jgi:hypothetical protein
VITVLFTQGHISIKRGRITKQYVPTMRSFNRLCHVLNYGPCETRYTVRSSVHTWHGRSSLTPMQIELFVAYARAYHNFATHLDRADMFWYMDGLRDACKIAGVHKLLLESINPCIHGNIPSICYTCATSM